MEPGYKSNCAVVRLCDLDGGNRFPRSHFVSAVGRQGNDAVKLAATKGFVRVSIVLGDLLES